MQFSPDIFPEFSASLWNTTVNGFIKPKLLLRIREKSLQLAVLDDTRILNRFVYTFMH